MAPKVEPQVTENVQKVLEVLRSDRQLTREIHEVFAKVYLKAGVQLTPAEKAGLFTEIGQSFGERFFIDF